MIPRSQQAAIQRANECMVQTISAFGKTHPLAQQAKELEQALTAEAERLAAPKTLLELFEGSEPQPALYVPPAGFQEPTEEVERGPV